MASLAERAMSFGRIADDYDRFRSGPADAAVDWLVPADCAVAVDVGAGTGKLSRALQRRAGHVIAVEPDDRMRAVLQARSPGVEVVAGRGEAIPLPDASADGVFISSAWHWMDPELALPEICRVLRDGGRFGVLWTSRDDSVGWVRDLNRLREAGERSPAGNPGTGQPAHGSPAARSLRHAVQLPGRTPLRNVVTDTFGFTRPMTTGSLVEMLGTYSGLITASPQDRAARLDRVRAALEQRFPGSEPIEVPMRSWCWRADRASRAG
jgi:SAM-dependent methyltransferase